MLTGIGTVREDDPRLDVRLVPTDLQPLRVVVDSRLDIAPSARVLQPPGRALVYTASDDAARMGALAAAHIEVARLPADAQGKTDLAAMLADLARREVNELHVEAGEKLNASLLREGLVDELLVYIAPRLLGPGRGIAAIGPLATLAGSLEFEFVDVERVGDDLRLRLRPPGRAVFRQVLPESEHPGPEQWGLLVRMHSVCIMGDGLRVRSSQGTRQPASRVSFAHAEQALRDPMAQTIEDPDAEGEQRFITLGMDALGRVLVVIHTQRGERTRPISARKASRGEADRYHA